MHPNAPRARRRRRCGTPPASPGAVINMHDAAHTPALQLTHLHCSSPPPLLSTDASVAVAASIVGQARGQCSAGHPHSHTPPATSAKPNNACQAKPHACRVPQTPHVCLPRLHHTTRRSQSTNPIPDPHLAQHPQWLPSCWACTLPYIAKGAPTRAHVGGAQGGQHQLHDQLTGTAPRPTRHLCQGSPPF